MRRTALACLLVLTGSLPAAAQGPTAGSGSGPAPAVVDAPAVEPGSVVSAIVRIPVGAEADSARYRIEPGIGVMLYGAADGLLPPEVPETLLPLTFSVPRSQAAGVMHVARITVDWRDGSRWQAEVQAEVNVRRALALHLDGRTSALPAGTTRRVPFTIENHGNAVDTVRLNIDRPAGWTTAVAADTIVLEPGRRFDSSYTVTAPEGAPAGEIRVLRLTATGLGSAAGVSGSFEVGTNADTQGGWIRLPATVTVGLPDAAAAGDRLPVAALEAQGNLTPLTTARLVARYDGDRPSSPAFQRHMIGPSLRAELFRPEGRIALGDVTLGGNALLGSYVQATGIDGRWQTGRATTSLFIAAPGEIGAPARDGHLARVHSATRLGAGELSVSAADLVRPYGISGRTERSSLATVGYHAGGLNGHRVRAEAGLMRIEDVTGASATGATVDGEYRYHDARFDVGGRLRRVPGSTPTSGSAIDETGLSFAARLGRGLSAQGWGAHSSSGLGDDATSRRAAAAGLRWRAGDFSTHLTAHYSDSEGDGLLSSGGLRRSISAGAAGQLAGIRVEATMETGTIANAGTSAPMRAATVRASHQRNESILWVGSSYSEGLFGSRMHRVDAGASIRLDRIELDGGVGGYLGAAGGSGLVAWSSAQYALDSRTSVIGGVDYLPWGDGGSSVRFSLGARRSFALPLPMRRQASIDGALFEDRNGNLLRDPGEPPLGGVLIRRGPAFATTDDEGRFAFYDSAPNGTEARIDVTSLPTGMLVPPDVRLAGGGFHPVPIHPSASLELRLFNDLIADGRRGPSEPAAAHATVVVSDSFGRTRVAAADSTGTARFGALPPGNYSIHGRPPRGQRAGTPITIDLHVLAGGEHIVDVPIAARPMEIRFGNEAAPPAPADSAVISATADSTPPADSAYLRTTRYRSASDAGEPSAVRTSSGTGERPRAPSATATHVSPTGRAESPADTTSALPGTAATSSRHGVFDTTAISTAASRADTSVSSARNTAGTRTSTTAVWLAGLCAAAACALIALAASRRNMRRIDPHPDMGSNPHSRA